MTAALKLVHNAATEPARKDYINRFTQSEPRTGVLFADFVRDTAARKAKRMGESYKAKEEV